MSLIANSTNLHKVNIRQFFDVGSGTKAIQDKSLMPIGTEFEYSECFKIS